MKNHKKIIRILYVFVIVILLYGNVHKGEEIQFLHSQQTQLVNNYVQYHQICWFDAVESIEMKNFQENSFLYFYDRLKESMWYYEIADRIRHVVDKNADAVSCVYVRWIYIDYLNELSMYRGKESELKDSEIFEDIKIIADWLKKRNINSEFNIYDDMVFKTEISDKLKSEYVKKHMIDR